MATTERPDGPDEPIDPAATPETPLGRLIDLPIEEELKDSYLTYSMSVIVSLALPDVRDAATATAPAVVDRRATASTTAAVCARADNGAGPAPGQGTQQDQSEVHPPHARASAITPVVSGRETVPAPMALARVK